MRRVAVVIVLIATLVATAQVYAEDQPSPAPPPAQAEQATLVKKVVKRPPRVVHRRSKFTPWAKPSPAQARTIIRLESARYAIPASALARRVACESRFRWWASNGQYQGLLQFSYGTFSRGMGSIGSREVRLVSRKLRRMHSRVYRHWSNGRVTRNRGRIVRQTVVRVRRGWIPRHPVHSHGWAQIRIGAQAIRGISAVRSSEWACSA